jgi:hypothetical protein
MSSLSYFIAMDGMPRSTVGALAEVPRKTIRNMKNKRGGRIN